MAAKEYKKKLTVVYRCDGFQLVNHNDKVVVWLGGFLGAHTALKPKKGDKIELRLRKVRK
ncbi:hypothetical protein LCGC14_2305670 [marine sediment metagenome]|uniref:Uncharacterized protein n=1 Tax=marine sediment metagenome TaxID=412755 RepID=A0A0F9FH39_9ZZZZ